MENKIPRRITQKHDTEENWLKAENFIPLQDEWIVYDEDDTHPYKRAKLGNGYTNINYLPFIDDYTELETEKNNNFEVSNKALGIRHKLEGKSFIVPPNTNKATIHSLTIPQTRNSKNLLNPRLFGQSVNDKGEVLYPGDWAYISASITLAPGTYALSANCSFLISCENLSEDDTSYLQVEIIFTLTKTSLVTITHPGDSGDQCEYEHWDQFMLVKGREYQPFESYFGVVKPIHLKSIYCTKGDAYNEVLWEKETSDDIRYSNFLLPGNVIDFDNKKGIVHYIYDSDSQSLLDKNTIKELPYIIDISELLDDFSELPVSSNGDIIVVTEENEAVCIDITYWPDNTQSNLNIITYAMHKAISKKEEKCQCAYDEVYNVVGNKITIKELYTGVYPLSQVVTNNSYNTIDGYQFDIGYVDGYLDYCETSLAKQNYIDFTNKRFVKQIKTKILTSDMIQDRGERNNLHWFGFKKETDDITYGTYNKHSCYSLPGYECEWPGGDFDVPENIGRCISNGSDTFYVIGFSRGTQLWEAQDALNDLTFTYTLAEPEYIDLSAQLTGYENELILRVENGCLLYTDGDTFNKIKFTYDKLKLIDNEQLQEGLDTKLEKGGLTWNSAKTTLTNGNAQIQNNAFMTSDSTGSAFIKPTMAVVKNTTGGEAHLWPDRIRLVRKDSEGKSKTSALFLPTDAATYETLATENKVDSKISGALGDVNGKISEAVKPVSEKVELLEDSMIRTGDWYSSSEMSSGLTMPIGRMYVCTGSGITIHKTGGGDITATDGTNLSSSGHTMAAVIIPNTLSKEDNYRCKYISVDKGTIFPDYQAKDFTLSKDTTSFIIKGTGGTSVWIV